LINAGALRILSPVTHGASSVILSVWICSNNLFSPNRHGFNQRQDFPTADITERCRCQVYSFSWDLLISNPSKWTSTEANHPVEYRPP